MDEQKIDDLINEIRNLVRTIERTGSPSSASGANGSSETNNLDRGINRIVNALGKLDSTIRGQDATRKAEQHSMKRFTAEVNRATVAQENQASSINAARAQTNALAQGFKSVAQAAKVAASQAASNSQRQATAATNSAKLEKATAGLKYGMENALKSISALALKSQASNADFAGTISDATTPVLKFASVIGGPVIKGLSLLGIGLLKLGVLASKQADEQLKAFDELSKIGGSSIGSLQNLFELTKAFNYTSSEASKLAALIAKNSQNIAMFGNGVAGGAKAIGKIMSEFSSGTDSFREQFNSLGMGFEEQNAALMGYTTNQIRLGRSRQLQEKGAAATFAEYLKNIEAVNRLTGADREKQENAMAKTMAKEQFRTALEQAKVKAQRGDTGELEQLTKLQEVITVLEANGAQDHADQLRALGGGVVGAKGAEGITKLLGGAASQMIGGLNKGTDTDTFVKELLDKVGEAQIGSFGTVGRVGGQEGISGLSTAQTFDAKAKLSGGVSPLAVEGNRMAAEIARINKQLESPDPELRKKAERERANLVKGQNINDFIQQALPYATDATTKFAQTMEWATETLKTQKGSPERAKSDDANWKAMTLMQKSESGIARGIEGIFDLMGLSYVAEQARGNRIENEGRYFKNVLEASKNKSESNLGPGKENLTPEQIAAAAARTVLESAPKYADGGIAKGPGGGHIAMLHGTEAVIPLAGGSVPVSISGGIGQGEVGSGPAFSKVSEMSALMEKVIAGIDKSNLYLKDILDEITGGETVGGAKSSNKSDMTAAMNAHDKGHQHEAPTVTPEAAQQLGKGIGSPLEDLKVTSGFGMRVDPITGKQAGHGGVDLAGRAGDAIKAPEAGTARVVSEAASGGYGNMVEILDSQGKVMHRMAHMSETMVKTGDKIEAGAQIGKVGSTGRSTGNHLHWEKFDPTTGTQVDPMAWLAQQQGKTPDFGSTAGGAATGNPQAARRGQKYGAPQVPNATDMSTYMKTVAMLESGGDPTAKAGSSNGKQSSAGGLFQFLEKSYEGITGRAGSAAERFDPAKATEAMQKLTMMNKGQMEKGLGREVSGEDLYMGHFMGAGGATKFLNAKDRDPNQSAAKFDPAAAASNQSIYYDQKDNNRERSMAEVHDLMTAKYRKQQAEIQNGQKLPDIVAALGTGGMPLAGTTPTTPTTVAGTASPVTGFTPAAQTRQAQQPTTIASMAQNILGSMFGGFGSTMPAGMAAPEGVAAPSGIAGPTLPGPNTDMSAITQALQAQTTATQSAITSSMENMTSRLVESLGSASSSGGVASAEVPALLGDIVSAQREQTAAINRLISVQTA